MCIICSQHRPKYLYINNYIHYYGTGPGSRHSFHYYYVSLLQFHLPIFHFIYTFSLVPLVRVAMYVWVAERSSPEFVRDQDFAKPEGKEVGGGVQELVHFLLTFYFYVHPFSLLFPLSFAKNVCIRGLLYNSEK